MTGSVPHKLASLERKVAQVMKGQRIAHGASIENATLTVNDSAGSLRTVLGPLGDGTVGVMAVNGPPPPQPSPPVVASVLGGVSVGWDGMFAGGAVIPMDWQRVEVHASALAVYEPSPTTLITTIETAQGATVIVPSETAVYVRLLARSTSGTASPPSVTVGPFGPAPVVATDLLDGIVTELKLADDAVTAAKVAAGAIDTAAIADSAINAQKIGAAAVIAGKLAASAVTSTTIANDAVTAGKVAADAITAREITAGSVNTAELAAGAVTTTELAANAVTAGKIAASQIQATHITANAIQSAAIAADAVDAGKIAADAVTAREIAALTITAAELAANAITVGKIAAGAVDATALSATAITGKTITGGTVTGALIQTAATGERITLNESSANKVLVYDGSIVSAIAELSKRGLLVQGTNGSTLWLDPNNAFPNLRLTNAGQTNSAVINVSENTTGAADLGMNSGTFTGSSFSDMKWRTFFGNDFWVAERIRDSSPATYIGGRLFLSSTSASISYRNATDSSQDAFLSLQQGVANLIQARLALTPTASANPGLNVNVPTAHTGTLLTLQQNGVDRLKVDAAGTLTAGNMAFGNVSITPSAANTPTSSLVTYNVSGAVVRGYATANTTVPGTRAPVGSAGVTGVAVSSVTNTSMLVWVNRENTTSTVVNWQAIGAPA